MSHPPSPRDTHPPPSTMSEFDSLSDSEWLDISSGRDSDEESLSDHDSDRDGMRSVPRSRRSSISNDDSATSDVEAWEGFVSDGGEEPEIGMYPVAFPSPLGAEPIAVGFVSGPAKVEDGSAAEEDQRVKQALDQSFIGTLNNSRSSNSGPSPGPSSASVRDLRLSFPDPLNSPKDELNRSYEDVPSPTETTISASTDNDACADAPLVSNPLPLLEDPGLSTSTPAVQYQHHEVQTELESKDALHIVLYGSSSEVKWQFLQELIQKALITSGYVFVSKLRENEQTQSVRLVRNSENSLPFFSVIHIHDRTARDANVGDAVDIPETNGYPSLAVVYLPAAKLPVLSRHSAYLPVVVPSITDLDEEIMRQGAEDDWDLLGISNQQTLRLGLGLSPVIDAADIAKVDPTHAYHSLRGIGREVKKTGVSSLKPLTERVKSMNATTLFALMSIVVGFAFNSSFRPSVPAPTRTVSPTSSSNGQPWSIISSQPNGSVMSSGKGRTSAESASVTDFGVPAYRSVGTSLSIASPRSMSFIVASTSKAATDAAVPTTKCTRCEKVPEKPKGSTDMVLRSAKATSLAQIPSAQPASRIVTTHTSMGAASTSSIMLGAERSLSFIPKSTVGSVASAVANLKAGPVSEVFEKALTKAVGRDLAQLAGAADELLESLREQRDSVIRQSKGKARAFGDQLQNLNDGLVKRNERAKRRAKMLKNIGESLAKGVKKELKARSDRAQRRAKQLREAVVEHGVEVFKTYERSVEVWESALAKKARGDDTENVPPKDQRGCRRTGTAPSTRWPMNARHTRAKANSCA